MSKKPKSPFDRPARILKKSTLATGLAIGFAFSLVMGVTAGAMGLGSLYPRLNLIAQPFVCPGGLMSYSQQVSSIGTANYYTAKWMCTDTASYEIREIDASSVHLTAGIFYGIAFFVILLLITYLYWHSSIGPARNGGPLLW